MSLPAGHVIETDQDFEAAIKNEDFVHVSQNNVRQRPITTISSYNEKTFTLSDGRRFLRNAHDVRTLTHEERLPHLMGHGV